MPVRSVRLVLIVTDTGLGSTVSVGQTGLRGRCRRGSRSCSQQARTVTPSVGLNRAAGHVGRGRHAVAVAVDDVGARSAKLPPMLLGSPSRSKRTRTFLMAATQVVCVEDAPRISRALVALRSVVLTRHHARVRRQRGADDRRLHAGTAGGSSPRRGSPARARCVAVKLTARRPDARWPP